MVIAFAGGLTKRNTPYSSIHGESPDCHFDTVSLSLEQIYVASFLFALFIPD